MLYTVERVMPSKHLLLVGGGHAHIQVLKAMHGQPIAVTLVSDDLVAPYSGMLPGCLAGQYEPRELSFELAKICRRAGHRFIQQRAQRILPAERIVELSNGEKLSYDVCSLNVGIVPRELEGTTDTTQLLYVKPVASFLQRWRSATEHFHGGEKFVVIGSGAAAFELAIALAERGFSSVTLVTAEKGLVLPPRLAKLGRRALARLGVQLWEGERVSQVSAGRLQTPTRQLEFDLALVATSASPTEAIRGSELPKFSAGHVLIDDYLRVKGYHDLFAAGDCAHLESHPLPKAGVYAVRQGTVLRHNLLVALNASGALRPYRPQRQALALLISGHQRAILSWRGWAIEGRWVARLKHWIDRRFMERFS